MKNMQRVCALCFCFMSGFCGAMSGDKNLALLKVPTDGYHTHVPALCTLAGHVVYEKFFDKRESLMQLLVNKVKARFERNGTPKQDEIVLTENLFEYLRRLQSGEDVASENLSEASYAIQYKKADPRILYPRLCTKGSDYSQCAATLLILHGVCHYADKTTTAANRAVQADATRKTAAQWAVQTGNEDALLVLLNGFDKESDSPESLRHNQEVVTDILKRNDAALLRFSALFGLETGVSCLLKKASRYLQGYEYQQFLWAEDNGALRNAAARWAHELASSDFRGLAATKERSRFRGCTTLLIAAGANIHAQGENVLCMMVKCGDADMVKDLLQRGANPHAADDAAIKCADAALEENEKKRVECEAALAKLQQEEEKDSHTIEQEKQLCAARDALVSEKTAFESIVQLLNPKKVQ